MLEFCLYDQGLVCSSAKLALYATTKPNCIKQLETKTYKNTDVTDKPIFSYY